MAIFRRIASLARFAVVEAAHSVADFEDGGRVEWFEGNFQDYEKNKMRPPGRDSIIPHRVKDKNLTR